MTHNIYIVRGYRINFNSYWKASKSFFMMHNETINVWSHFSAAVFFLCLIFYVFMVFQPSSLKERNIVTKWTTRFDQGEFDSELTCKSEVDFKNTTSCPVSSEALLDDLFESESIVTWHDTQEGNQSQQIRHFNLNYHASAYEKLEHFLRNALAVLQKPQRSLQSCISCLSDTLQLMP